MTIKEDIAAIKTHINYIKENLTNVNVKLDNHISHIRADIVNIDDRLDTIINWRSSVEQNKTSKKTWLGYGFAVLTFCVATLFNLVALYLQFKGGI